MTDSEKVVMKQKLLDVDEVFVYRIPALRSSGGHRQVMMVFSFLVHVDSTLNGVLVYESFSCQCLYSHHIRFCLVCIIYFIALSCFHNSFIFFHRAEDWDLAKPLQTCSLLVERKDDSLTIAMLSKKLKEGGPKGATEDTLFAMCLVDLQESSKKMEHFVEAVVDSSRYFVVRISDQKTGRHANIGVGFRERDDASNFRMALQEYERSLERERTAQAMHNAYENEEESESSDSSPSMPQIGNLTLKEGEKIHIDLKGSKTTTVKDTSTSKKSGGALPLLKKPPPSPAVPTAQQGEIKAVGGIDLKDAISDVGSTVGSEGAVASLTDDEEWNDFEG